MTELEAVVLLHLLKVPPAQQATLAEHFAALSACFDAPLDAVVKPLAAFSANPGAWLQRARDFIGTTQDAGIDLVAWPDPVYPSLLREIHHPPLLLFARGNLTALSLPQIAVVGSRNASGAGVRLAEDFSTALAAAGFAITSGLALGIDAAAHRGALKTGFTIAVVGAGVDVVYPRQHEALYRQIIAAGGVVVSEQAPGARPLRGHFPRRNRIISGLSAGVLVVEAALKSGSLITARLAMEQGREVFAVPGSIHNPLSRGCHRLIRDGAVLTETVDDIVAQLGGMLAFKAQECAPERSSNVHAVTPSKQKLLDAMGFDPVDFDTLADRAALASGELTATLSALELDGLIEKRAGWYQRVP